MKFMRYIFIAVLSALLMTDTVMAAGMQNGSSQYNPWRQQPRQWGYQTRQNGNSLESGHAMGVRPQLPYSAPLNRIPARQFEYRRYIQQVNPYYSNQMPWWSDPVAVPYGPWSLGNNGIW